MSDIKRARERAMVWKAFSKVSDGTSNRKKGYEAAMGKTGLSLNTVIGLVKEQEIINKLSNE